MSRKAATGHHHIRTRKSLILQSSPAAGAPFPRIRRAPSFRFAVNRSRAPANASFTKSLLPITAPSVKYLTRQRSIAAMPRSGSTVPLSSAASASAVFICGRTTPVSTSCPTAFPAQCNSHRPPANPRNLRPSLRLETRTAMAHARPDQSLALFQLLSVSPDSLVKTGAWKERRSPNRRCACIAHEAARSSCHWLSMRVAERSQPLLEMRVSALILPLQQVGGDFPQARRFGPNGFSASIAALVSLAASLREASRPRIAG